MAMKSLFATHCNTMQHAPTRCTTLQHTAQHCNTPCSSTPECHKWLCRAHNTTSTPPNSPILSFAECHSVCVGSHSTQDVGQHTATHCNTLQHTASHDVGQCVFCPITITHYKTHYNTLQHVATHCNTLHHTMLGNAYFVPHYNNALQHVATRCKPLQHTATQGVGRCAFQPAAVKTSVGSYGVASISRRLKMVGLFCKRAL